MVYLALIAYHGLSHLYHYQWITAQIIDKLLISHVEAMLYAVH